MIKIVFISNDEKSLSILKMSIPGINISLSQMESEYLSDIRRNVPDIILIDLDSQNDEWTRLFMQIQKMNRPPYILVTGKTENRKTIIETLKMGAAEFIPKPYIPENISQMEKIIKKLITLNLSRSSCVIPANAKALDSIIGSSKKIMYVKNLISNYAVSDAPVFLLGESGVGKNLVAQTIHNLSERSNSIYKTIHTGALPPTLIESELYGTKEGAFTGAKSRAGCFETASKGTLFLDEIGELPVSSQVKLLRILEDNTITRLGDSRQIPIDVRIISATNINIKRAVRNKSFRKDLYYRISTLFIYIPPLRERKEDIPVLVDHFLKESEPEYKISGKGLEKLINHSWPGNIRELKNILERAMIFTRDMHEINEYQIEIEEF